ncbi:MAG: Transcriptional regulatory protein DegU [Chloroflexi bacterium ADurb.Bin325]|nr:MAG: Transcriptional regulatory protein DegU [Chloroflexi bacterium ADurb.Bin325]
MTTQPDLGQLSERELEVVKLVATGATNQQIARALAISPNTVKVHLRNIFEKLGVQSRTEATMEAVRRGWVAVSSATLIAATATPPPAEAAQPTILLAEASARPAPAPWQRAYFIVALVVVIVAALAPVWWQGTTRAAPSTPFSDRGQPQMARGPRVDVARWSASAALPTARSRLAVVAAEGKIYAIGGEGADGVTDEMAVYDPPTNGWLPGPHKPTPTANIAAAALNGRIYVPGGSTATGGVTNVLEVYDVAAGVWRAAAPLPRPVAGYALAAAGGKIYLFGGWDGQQYRAETYIYDPATAAWSEGVALPTPRAFAAAAALDNRIFVVGGFDGQAEMAEALAYNTAAGPADATPWSLRSPLSQPRGGLGLAAIGARLYAVGGGWQSDLAYSEQYDTRLDAWSKFGTPIVGRWRNLGLAPWDGRLHAVGGWDGAYLDAHEQYQALLRQLLPIGGSSQ